VTDATKGPAKTGSETAQDKRGRRLAEPSGTSTLKARSDAVRSKIATVVWLAAVVCALFLAVGALLIALGANEDNSIVVFINSTAEKLDGPFSLKNGIFTFSGNHDGEVKSALTNWGIAAVVYLVIGKILDRIIRP
jgi:hypothetical protein